MDLEKRAQQGDAFAQFYLGINYEHGQGVPQDKAKALEWITKSANLGFAEAQRDLASRYYFGCERVPQNYVLAAEWYTKAAKQGNRSAQYSLAGLYLIGTGVIENRALAKEWLEKAAAQGHEPAKKELKELFG